MNGETAETRLKRLRLQSWRRGTREMDLILGRFADESLASLPADSLEDFERLLLESDQDLYSWASGSAPAPPALTAIVERVRTFHSIP